MAKEPEMPTLYNLKTMLWGLKEETSGRKCFVGRKSRGALLLLGLRFSIVSELVELLVELSLQLSLPGRVWL